MILITGGGGRLGRALRRELPDAAAPVRAELDLCDEASVRALIGRTRPSAVIHAAAYTDVRGAEAQPAACWAVNVEATERLVRALTELVPDCYFVYISTACIFAGDVGNYTEESIPRPCNFYGLTKLLGEIAARRMRNHLVARTNFVERGPWPYPRAFSDRFGTYLFAEDVARALPDLLRTQLQGIVHIAGDRRLSMFELARMSDPLVQPMTRAECDLPLTADMTLLSLRLPPYRISAAARSG